MQPCFNDLAEWLETDGLGGFASGTVGGIRTRRYHGLLLSAVQPPTKRFMLVNGVEATVTTPAGSWSISSQRYDGQVVATEGHKYVESFTDEPWPTWVYRLPDGTRIEQQILMKQDTSIVAISWRVMGSTTGVSMSVRPLISGRDYHALHRENPSFNFTAEQGPGWVRFKPYEPVPAVMMYSNAKYTPHPLWYRNFFYQQEWLRGFEAIEDLASPGEFQFDLSRAEAILILAAQTEAPVPLPAGLCVEQTLSNLRMHERTRRRKFASRLERAADQYIVRRGEGKSIIAGYPWFADWGRDTFISLRGLCLATNRLDDARSILVTWARYVSDGVLPNRFPDAGEELEYNTVDAALWYVIGALEFLDLVEKSEYFLPVSTRELLLNAVEKIIAGYEKGTHHGIQLDSDGLIAAGEPGFQLTWMDARVDGRVITPRIGKPVEIQALWLNALHLAAPYFPRWRQTLKRGIDSFRRKFWNAAGEYLYDVVDVDHEPGKVDATFRPNQIFAVGGLPLNLLDPLQAQSVVNEVEKRLLTPLGLRSLAPDDPNYSPRYSGNSAQRDSVYHQGPVWPWLMGAFVEAWVRVRGSSDDAKRAARKRFLAPLLRDSAGIGHICELADGDAPHMPRGCPFQAWSVAEALRLDRVVLQVETPTIENALAGPARRRVRTRGTGLQPVSAAIRTG